MIDPGGPVIAGRSAARIPSIQRDTNRRAPLNRFSLFSTLYVVAGAAGFFAIVGASNRYNESIVSWVVHSLGFAYGTLLYTSGLLSLYMTCRAVMRAPAPAYIATALPLAFLPTFIGVIGVMHGYIHIYRVLALSGTYPKPLDLYYAYASVLACLLAGLCLTAPAFAIISLAMLRYPRHCQSDAGAI